MQQSSLLGSLRQRSQRLGLVPETHIDELRLQNNRTSTIKNRTVNASQGAPDMPTSVRCRMAVHDTVTYVTHEEAEAGTLLETRLQVARQLHQSIDTTLEADVAVSAPHEPQLEDVVVTSALYRLVARVVGDVVVLVGLEQVRGLHRIRSFQPSLCVCPRQTYT